MTVSAASSYAGYHFPAEIISHPVWLYFRLSFSLRMVDELLAAHGIVVSHGTVQQWALTFGQAFANQIWRGLNNCTENSHQPTRRRERQMKRFKLSAQA